MRARFLVWRALRLALTLSVVATFSRPVFAQDATAAALTREREEQTGTAISILFDNSGSMKGDKIRQAKSAFRLWLQTVPEDYKFSLITFEGEGKIAVPLGEHTRDAVVQHVSRLAAETGTPICGALRVARAQIEQRRRDVTPYERHVVLIFTDGKETSDPRGNQGVIEDIATLRAESVEVVGVGFHGEGDYMDGAATRFALANNERELQQGLAKVDAEIGSVDDLVVSPQDLAALKTSVPAAAEAAALLVSPGVKVAAKKKGLPVGWIFVAGLGWLVLRRVLHPAKTRPR